MKAADPLAELRTTVTGALARYSHLEGLVNLTVDVLLRLKQTGTISSFESPPRQVYIGYQATTRTGVRFNLQGMSHATLDVRDSEYGTAVLMVLTIEGEVMVLEWHGPSHMSVAEPMKPGAAPSVQSFRSPTRACNALMRFARRHGATTRRWARVESTPPL